MIPFVTWGKQMCSLEKKDQNVIFLEFQGHILKPDERGVCVCVCVCVYACSGVEWGGKRYLCFFVFCFSFLFLFFPFALKNKHHS